MTGDHDHSQMQAALDQILTDIDQILSEQRRTNGRIGKLEQRAQRTDRLLYGDARMGEAGLVASSHAADDMVRQWQTLMRVGRWVAVTFGTASVMLLANLAQQAF